jgi:hypothetical protein
LHERVRVDRLNLIRERNPVLDAGHFGRLLALRRALRVAAPDLVISFLDKLNVAVLLAVVGTGIRVIATEHLVPWRHPMGAVWETLRRLVYRRAARIVSPTAGIRDYLVQSVPGRYTVLGYPAELLPGPAFPVTNRAPLIFAAGRLAPEKGFDVRGCMPSIRPGVWKSPVKARFAPPWLRKSKRRGWVNLRHCAVTYRPSANACATRQSLCSRRATRLTRWCCVKRWQPEQRSWRRIARRGPAK